MSAMLPPKQPPVFLYEQHIIESVTDQAGFSRMLHPRLFVLRKRLALCLTLIAMTALLLIVVSVAAVLGVGVLGAYAAWSVFGAEWPVLAFFLGGIWFVATGFFAVRLSSVLFVPLPLPEGVSLSPEDARSLHKLIEGMAWVLEAGRIDHVWVTPEMNAAVLQRPRRGFFGRVETHLLIGLPLMHSVTCPQLVAVLAHEFAHLAVQRKGAGKYGALLRAWWLRALDRLGDLFPAIGAQVDCWLGRFYSNMARLARIEEFEADAQATKVVDAGLLGETLIEVSLKEQFLSGDYWPRVLAQSRVRAKPLVRPFRDLCLGMSAGFLHHVEQGDMLSGKEPFQSMHPTTRERLRALRVSPTVFPCDLPSAANRYLLPLLLTLAWVFDRAWWRGVRPDWQLTYRMARREHRRERERGCEQ
ncbi:MAG: M48 family metalloprotease [Betaproteobacteria bacterium]|nr:M48 family metalloprotease [Betaproteobacteria bacterium]